MAARSAKSWTTAACGAAMLTASVCSPAEPGHAADAAAPVVTPPDPCKPDPVGAPEVEVGEGQNAFAPLVDHQTVQVEKGPQGGYHIWLAVRMKNLARSGSHTSISAASPASEVSLASYEVVFTFDRDEAGFCRLYGLRYRIDASGVDYQLLLDRELDVTVRVTDPSGATATGHKVVTLSADVI